MRFASYPLDRQECRFKIGSVLAGDDEEVYSGIWTVLDQASSSTSIGPRLGIAIPEVLFAALKSSLFYPQALFEALQFNLLNPTHYLSPGARKEEAFQGHLRRPGAGGGATGRQPVRHRVPAGVGAEDQQVHHQRLHPDGGHGRPLLCQLPHPRRPCAGQGGFIIHKYRAGLNYHFQVARIFQGTAGNKFSQPGKGNLAHPCT